MSCFLRRVKAPSGRIIDLQEAKDQLRELSNDRDGEIISIIEQVTDILEGPNGRLGKALATQTWSVSVDAPVNNSINLPLPPVQSVTSVEYYDSNDESQSLDVNDFYLYADDDSAFIEPKSKGGWPSTISRKDAISVTFITGYDDLPAALKRLALLLVVHFYDNKSPVTDRPMHELPMSVESLLDQHKSWWIR